MGGKKHQTPDIELEKLQQRRSKLMENINRIRLSITNKTISLNKTELECRLDILKSYIDQVMNLQSEIEVLDPSDDLRERVEDTSVSAKTLLLNLVSRNRKSSIAETSFCAQAHTSRLPNMRLPKFSGKYADYKNFMGLFENLVDNDPTLTDIEKFNHLISCLSDEALGTVRAFQISETNYPKALASLKRVYDNKCLIFFDNISKLFDLPEIHKPSASALRSMIDTVSAIYDSLLSIGDDKNITNAMLIHLVMSKVDHSTKSKWEEQLNFEQLPLWSECEAALNKRYQHISADETSNSKLKSVKARHEFPSKKSSRTSLSCSKTKHNNEKCLMCKSIQHLIDSCPSFTAMPVLDRFNFVKSIPACINCFKQGHTVAKCKSEKCRICGSSHNSLLHRYTTSQQGESDVVNSMPIEASSLRASANHSSSNENTILATAVVEVQTRTGEFILARALLDSGSQPNLITEDLVQKLQLKKCKDILNLTGIGEIGSSSKSNVQVTFKSRLNATKFSSKFWVLQSITNQQPDRNISIRNWIFPKNIELADPYFFRSQKIDLLLGAEVFYELLCVGQIKKGCNQPILQKTTLGWIVGGKYGRTECQVAKVYHLNYIIEDEMSLDATVQKFWELEQLPGTLKVKFTDEQSKCEEHFYESLRRLPSGRFQVSLPFKTSPSVIGSSFENARRRFFSLERRLSQDDQMRVMYHDFMGEYLDLGHMSLSNEAIPSRPHYFIPHQCVLRPESLTTKLRVVFDASSRTSSQLSLNDILMVGPTIQNDLYSILMRFRFHKYAITADVEKMYRQVLIGEADRDFQLVLYRRDPQEPLLTYRLNTVTYGTSSAPYLAIKWLVHLSEIYSEEFPKVSSIIRHDFYVDDLLTGAESLEEIQTIQHQISKVLESAGFRLTKWRSNNTEFDKYKGIDKFLKQDFESAKALGIHWNPYGDQFTFRFDDNFKSAKATKRNILSISSRLFDPLGLICPIVVRAKMLIQDLWLQKLDWDESIPMQLYSSWEVFKEDLLQIGSIRIPRFVQTTSQSKIQIHGFADASLRAYGCCIYIRSEISNKVTCNLLTAKSKVSPLKTKSLPRLELCAAHLLAELWAKMREMLPFKVESVTFWSDSEITLHWIKTHPSQFSVFVANRISEIQERTSSVSWRHVPGRLNPADIVSRGCDIEEIMNSMWFYGPPFLLEGSCNWPSNPHFEVTKDIELLEKRKSAVLVSVNETRNDLMELINRHSSYKKLLRVTAFVFRFVDFVKKLKISRSPSPTHKEINWSFLRLVEVVQRQYFSEELHKLKKSLALNTNIQKLTPFIHTNTEEGRTFSLIRVGGRLLNAPLPFNTKFPLLLPKSSHFVDLFVRNLHKENCHAGTRALVALSRERIWILNAREICKKIVRQCIHCFHYKPKLMNQIMGNLPSDRVKAIRPFLVVGVDFCGPVNVSVRIRGRPPLKMYIAVFVCFTSKAVHLELVSNLSSDCFILCFKRFAARRGLPTTVYCDNATNFVGASRNLKEIQEEFEAKKKAITSFGASYKVEFTFIPPRAPHFGGLWEAAVKQAKHLLLRTVGNAMLSAEEMCTMLAEVEAVLNSRPIAPMSSDPNDGEALTPSHLLIGDGLRSLPPGSDADVSDNKLKYLKRWQMLCTLKQRFWRTWSRDYVLGLQTKTKWFHEQTNLQIGTLVLVHEDNLPPQEWLTGRVVNVIQGQDGKVRVAEVRTKNGIFKRPIHKLAAIPID
ncbi:uncharacterized protein LOC142239573 [Haematobia irritans]|uniref:uncharacterized protein LOC142239573 n=1 Tax=Haematobia irritans TaxID=7368 RepID=UPI003F4F63A0